MTTDVKQAAQPSGAEKSIEAQASPSPSPQDNEPLDREHELLLKNKSIAALVENLTSGEEAEEETPPAPPPKTESTDGTAGSSEAPKSKAETPKTEEATPDPTKSSDSSKPTTVANTDPDLSYPDEKEVRGYTGNSQKRIRQLVSARKHTEETITKKDEEISKLRDRAKYRDDIESRVTELKIDPKAWDQWTNLGFMIQKEPQRAAEVLFAMSQNLGHKIPAKAKETEAADDALDADLVDLVKAVEITPAAAKKIQAGRRKAEAPATPTAPQPPRATETAAPGPSLVADPKDAGNRALEAVDAEYRKKYPDQWETLVPEVMKEMAQYQGAAPHSWGRIARDCAERVVKRKASTVVQPDDHLRPQGRRPRQEAPLNTREGLADAMASGEFFSQ